MALTLHDFQMAMGEHVCQAAQERVEIRAISYNSKEVVPGTLFFCKGNHFKPSYLKEALERGAVAYVAETDFGEDVPHILVDNMRHILAPCARLFYGDPQKKLQLLAVTGTKGKSSTVWYLKSILSACCKKHDLGPVGFLTSISNFDGGEEKTSTLTTPEPFELYAILARCVENGVRYVAFEVSSQALKVERTAGLHFAMGAFLNISPDHISSIEHPNFEDYFQSKLRLFSQSDIAIININSDHREEIEAAAASCKKIVRVGFSNQSDADVTATINDHHKGISFTVQADGKSIPLHLPEIGDYAMQNAAVAVTMALEAGVPAEEIPGALESVHIPGRMEFLSTGDGMIRSIIDFAHNGVSFSAVFEAAHRQFPDCAMLTVFGSTGGKAVNRRADLGRVADTYADRIILTMDDPNAEPLSSIYSDIEKSIRQTPYETIDDRKAAIEKAMDYAKEYAKNGKKSMLLLLGRGNETTMYVDGVARPYGDDRSFLTPLFTAYDKKTE